MTVIINRLCQKGKSVHAVSLRTVLEQFLFWLENRNPRALICKNLEDLTSQGWQGHFNYVLVIHCLILPLYKEQYQGLDK